MMKFLREERGSKSGGIGLSNCDISLESFSSNDIWLIETLRATDNTLLKLEKKNLIFRVADIMENLFFWILLVAQTCWYFFFFFSLQFCNAISIEFIVRCVVWNTNTFVRGLKNERIDSRTNEKILIFKNLDCLLYGTIVG